MCWSGQGTTVNRTPPPPNMNNFGWVGVSAFDLRCLLQIIHLGEKKNHVGVFLWKFQTIKRPFCIILHLDLYFSFKSISWNSAENCRYAVNLTSFLDHFVIARRTVVFYKWNWFRVVFYKWNWFRVVFCRWTWFRGEPSSSTEVLVPRDLLQRKWFRVELSSSPEELQQIWRLWCSGGGGVGHGVACFTICSLVVCFKIFFVFSLETEYFVRVFCKILIIGKKFWWEVKFWVRTKQSKAKKKKSKENLKKKRLEIRFWTINNSCLKI